jgi:hypothetical protein
VDHRLMGRMTPEKAGRVLEEIRNGLPGDNNAP